MKKILIFLLCIGSTIVSANPCEDAFVESIERGIQFNKERIASRQADIASFGDPLLLGRKEIDSFREAIANYRRRLRLYRSLHLVLEKIAADRSRNLTKREMTTIVTALQDPHMVRVVVKALRDNIPQSERFVLSFFPLLERTDGSERTVEAAAEIIALASEQPQFKDVPALQFTQLLKYPAIIPYLESKRMRIRELPPEKMQTMTSEQIDVIFGDLTLKQIQMLPPKEIVKYVSILPLDWIRALTQEQKRVVLQEGEIFLNKMSILSMRALGGLGAFYRENNNVRNAIEELRTQLNERELFILQNLLSDDPVAASEIAQRYSVSGTRIQQIQSRLRRKIQYRIWRFYRESS